jgi:hypothetical protein
MIIDTIFSAQLDVQSTQEEYLRAVANSAWCLGECLVALSKVENTPKKAQYVDRWNRLGLERYPWSANVVGGLAALAEFRFDHTHSRSSSDLNSLTALNGLHLTTPLGSSSPLYFRTHMLSALLHSTFSSPRPSNEVVHKTPPPALAFKPRRSLSPRNRRQNAF